jgi:hypothetical protein
MPTAHDLEKAAARANDKEERARDRMMAMQEYEAARLAKLENMARLRALRLAKEANEANRGSIPKPKIRRSKVGGLSKGKF